MRNPVYCGKMFIPAYKEEPSQFVKALHEPLVSEQVFDEAQAVLDGRSRDYKPKLVGETKFQLRGFILCPSCGKLLTASTSKGRTSYYSYYHCISPCKSRYAADTVNIALLNELKKYMPRKEALRLYAMTISESFHLLSNSIQREKTKIKADISDMEAELKNARRLIAKSKIEDDDFRELKSEYVNDINELEKKLVNLQADAANVDDLLDQGIEKLIKLDEAYKRGELYEKRKLVSAIYPENFTFDGYALRTTTVNSVVQLI